MKILAQLALVVLIASCAKARVIQNFTLRQSKVVIAHRGASGVLPEHTREALVMGHGMGADYIEVDVVASRDGELFVLHDLTLEATTNVRQLFPRRKRADGRYYAIDFSAAELKRLQVHERVHPESSAPVFPERFNHKNPTIFRMPTLDEQVDLLNGLNESRQKKTGLYLEIKSSEFHQQNKIDLVDLVAKKLASFSLSDTGMEVIIQSFNPNDLKRLRAEEGARYPLVQLIAENSWQETSADYAQMVTASGVAEIATYADGLGPWIYQLLRPESDQVVVTQLGRYAKKNGLFIHSYTARSDALPPFAKSYTELMELLFLGVQVDGIFTDQPDEAVRFLQNYSVRGSE